MGDVLWGLNSQVDDNMTLGTNSYSCSVVSHFPTSD
jgi:hypothetical protein